MEPLVESNKGTEPRARFKFTKDKPKSWGEPHKITIPDVNSYPTKFKGALELVNKEVQEMFEMASKLRENMDLYVMDGDFKKGVASVQNYNDLQLKMESGIKGSKF